jgi:hypothetical protein
MTMRQKLTMFQRKVVDIVMDQIYPQPKTIVVWPQRYYDFRAQLRTLVSDQLLTIEDEQLW